MAIRPGAAIPLAPDSVALDLQALVAVAAALRTDWGQADISAAVQHLAPHCEQSGWSADPLDRLIAWNVQTDAHRDMSIMQGVHLLIAKLRRKDNVPGGCFYATVEGPTPVEASPSPVAGAAGQAETGGTDTPDATGLVAGPMDKNAYRPANKIINEHPDVAKDIKALNRILAAHPEIRRWKPRQNRLSVHAGDWLKYVDAQAQGSQFMPEETHSPGAKPARPAAEAMRTGPGIQAWRCRSCQADYADQPRRCEKCGGGTFEPVIVRPSTPQQRRGK